MDTQANRRAVVRRGATLIAVTLAALIAVPMAAGHAVLVSTTPGNDVVLREAPRAVVLRFNEHVESAFGSVRVYDSQARRVDDGRVERPDERTVRIGVDRRLARGTYTVTWRVVSADSHPISGAFVFHIGVPGAIPAGIAAQVLDGGTPRAVSVLFTVVRFLVFALLLLVVGGAVALAYPLQTAATDVRWRLLAALGVWGAMLALAALASIVLQAAAAGGFGLAQAAHWNSVQAVLETRFGQVALVQVALGLVVAALAFAARRRPDGSLALALLIPAVALVPTPSLAGHASVSGGLALVADLVHVSAAAVWTGGLAFVVVALVAAGEERWPLAARGVPRFSRLAVFSVAALLVSGSVSAYEQVGAWRGFWETTYGLLLLAKVALVLPLLALGAYNNRYAVPRLKKQIASIIEQRRFLRAAGAELAIMAAIVGVTAVLVTEPPAKASIKPPKLFNTTAPLGNLELNMTVEPARTGPNVIHIYTFTQRGVPAPTAAARLSATLPGKSLGPLRIPLQRIGPFHYTVSGATFPQPGDWQMTIEARRGEFEALTQTITVPIREG